jgi:hypothetical protein
MPNIKKVYTVFSEPDAGGRGKQIGQFTDLELAKKAAAGKGQWGEQGIITEDSYIKADDQWFLLVNAVPVAVDIDGIEQAQKTRQQALAKLNDAEREALGL